MAWPQNNPPIAELLGEMLEWLGHKTTVSNSPVHALELIRQGEFDAILSDFRMPVLNGQQFYEKAVALRPSLAHRFIFLTGDVVNEETQSWLKQAGALHLAKPFQLTKVEEALATLLANVPKETPRFSS